MKIVIPARMGSKGLPFKNRKLFEITAKMIPEQMQECVYVSTDDPEIMKMASKYNFTVVTRPDKLSGDEVSTKDVIKHMIDTFEWNDIIIMLYLTYPERTWLDICKAHEFFIETNAFSMLCKKEIVTSPFLMLKDEGYGRGSQLFYHDLYRRQDYPKCFEISHYVAIFYSRIINNLNNNLYNNDTVFMDISSDVIDVDEQKDLDKYND